MKTKMIEKINKQISDTVKKFEKTHEYSENDNAKIHGMIEMLELVTGNTYYYDENGVHEK